MNWVRNSIRNKLLAITGLGTGLLLAASGFGFWESWNAFARLQAVLGGHSATGAAADAAVRPAPAAALTIPMIQSGASLTPMEHVKKVGTTAWFQAYLPGDAQIITPLVERAQHVRVT